MLYLSSEKIASYVLSSLKLLLLTKWKGIEFDKKGYVNGTEQGRQKTSWKR